MTDRPGSASLVRGFRTGGMQNQKVVFDPLARDRYFAVVSRVLVDEHADFKCAFAVCFGGGAGRLVR
ncbi:MAG: hypothetical protein KAZ88_12485 [Acidimicrobiia bacterium]|nr:hypothetical protein [Acidimicrobiia bacterium]